MSEIHLKLYNFVESDKQLKQRDEFKTEFSRPFQEKFAKLSRPEEKNIDA